VSAESHTTISPLFGIAAEFETAEAIVEAARKTVAAGYAVVEGYTPVPIIELPEILGSRRTYVGPIVGCAALMGVVGGFGMQWFANVIHYPWNIAGKPQNSWPMWIPITFECGILASAVIGLIAMLALNGLPKPYHPMFRLDAFTRASKDRYFLCIESTDPKFDLPQTRQFLESLAPLAVMEVPR
jgi:hypothetical protein